MKQSSFAPGRVELLGNHTDYNGGVVLSAALDLGITARGVLRGDDTIVVRSEGVPEVSVSLNGLSRTGQWSDYPLGVVSVFLDAGHVLGGFEIGFVSTLPLGAGLSSSAALEVATGMFLMRLFGLNLDPLELAQLCRRAENEFVGVNCGLLDQVSSIFGLAGQAVFLDCRAETVENIAFPADTGILIINSGVKHALTGGEYNERREMCFEAAGILGVPALRDATSDQLAGAGLPAIVRRRATHITGENERVFLAVEALRSGDARRFGELMIASQESSIHNFENSTPELDLLCRLVTSCPGIHGARLTGGGFGGAIVAVGQSSDLEAAGQSVADAYHHQTGHTATPIVTAPGDGAWVSRK